MTMTDENDRRITAIPKGIATGPIELELVVVEGERVSRHRLPPTGKRVLGRSGKSDILIDDASISRAHAALHLGDEVSIEDLGSFNGTWVRGVRLEGGTRVKIAPGDNLRLGDAVIVLERAPRAAPIRKSSGMRRALDAAAREPEATIVVSPAMVRLYELADQVAAGTISVMILGDTGVGKELLAQRIHARSGRAAKPCVTLNCAAFSEPLLASELFGHEKGAFTGADSAKIGLLEVADGGTVFFDEIGELPPALQAKLLRVLEDGQVLPVGGRKAKPVDVRFIAATNRNLEAEVSAGRFRQDLYFRLSAATLVVPPLRDRIEDIGPLADHFLQVTAKALGRSTAPRLSAEALEALQLYAWPGNVRELRNMLERSLLLCGDGPVLLEHLPVERLEATLRDIVVASQRPRALSDHARAPTSEPEPVAAPPPVGGLRELKDDLRNAERERILQALEACAGNQTRAAEVLGISRRALVTKLERYAIPRPRKSPR